MNDYLFGVSAGDVATYATAAVVALGVCVGATLIATRRLRNADLAAVLRSD